MLSAALQIAGLCSASSCLTCWGLACRGWPSRLPGVSWPWLLQCAWLRGVPPCPAGFSQRSPPDVSTQVHNILHNVQAAVGHVDRSLLQAERELLAEYVKGIAQNWDSVRVRSRETC